MAPSHSGTGDKPLNTRDTVSGNGPWSSTQRWCLAAILVVAWGARLIRIDSPLTDGYSWRQAVTATIARNFARNGYNLLRPQGDWAGGGPGYIEMELPLYSYFVAVVYRFTGVREWVGRAVTSLDAVGCTACLFALGARWLGVGGGLWAAAFFALSPLCIYFGRTFQPDMQMMLFLLLGIVLLDRWCDDERRWHLVGACVALTLACMTKITAVHIYPLLAALPWRKQGWRTFTQARLWACVLAPVAATALWYAHTASLRSGGGLELATPTRNPWWGTWELWRNGALWIRMGLRVAIVVGTPVVTVLALAGVASCRWPQARRPLRVWALCGLIYLAGILRGQLHHFYYQLPLAPPLALAAAAALTSVPRRWQLLFGVCWLPVGGLFAAGWLGEMYRYDPRVTVAARSLQQVVPQGELLDLVASEHIGYALLYYADRKGWVKAPSLYSPEDAESHLAAGGRYIVLFPPERSFLPETQEFLSSHGNKLTGVRECVGYRVRAP